MYATISHQVAKDRAADLHRQARQDALARASRHGRRPHWRPSGSRVLRLPLVVPLRALTA